MTETTLIELEQERAAERAAAEQRAKQERMEYDSAATAMDTWAETNKGDAKLMLRIVRRLASNPWALWPEVEHTASYREGMRDWAKDVLARVDR